MARMVQGMREVMMVTLMLLSVVNVLSTPMSLSEVSIEVVCSVVNTTDNFREDNKLLLIRLWGGGEGLEQLPHFMHSVLKIFIEYA